MYVCNCGLFGQFACSCEHLLDACELNAFSALKPADRALSVLLWIPLDCVLRLFSRMVNAAAKHGNLQSAEGWFRAAQESCRNDAGYFWMPIFTFALIFLQG